MVLLDKRSHFCRVTTFLLNWQTYSYVIMRYCYQNYAYNYLVKVLKIRNFPFLLLTDCTIYTTRINWNSLCIIQLLILFLYQSYLLQGLLDISTLHNEPARRKVGTVSSCVLYGYVDNFRSNLYFHLLRTSHPR